MANHDNEAIFLFLYQVKNQQYGTTDWCVHS